MTPEDISICMGPMTVDESNHATGLSSFPHCANNNKWSQADNLPLRFTPLVCSKRCTSGASSKMEHLQAASKQKIQYWVCTYLWYFYSVLQLIAEHHETTLKMTDFFLNSGDGEVTVWIHCCLKTKRTALQTYLYESYTSTRLEKKITNAVKMRSLERIRVDLQ